MNARQKIGLMILSLPFSLIGAAVFYSMTIHPIVQAQRTQNWISAPCTIVKSELKTDATTTEPTYDADIQFRYRFRDAQYISEWYGFSRGYSLDRASKEALLNRYTAGKETVCFVNPLAPSNAVLMRELPADVWFGLIGAPFLLVGLGLFVYVAIQILKPLIAHDRPEASRNQGLRMKPVSSGQAGRAVFALVWNLFIGGAIYMVALQWKTKPNYIAAGILLLFAVAGVLILYSVLHRAFVIFSPRIEMKVHGYRLGPGERIELSWSISRSHLLTGVEIWLESGVNAVSVYISGEPPVPARGQASVKIPEDRPTNDPMLIHFVGHVKRFPNLDKKYVITL